MLRARRPQGTARSALTGTVGQGRSRFEKARDGLRPLGATAHNAARARLRFGHIASRTRSAPPRDRETNREGPVSDFLVTRGRTQGNGSSTRSGLSPARRWPMSRASRTRSASAERAQSASAPSRSKPERSCSASGQHNRRSSEPAAGEAIELGSFTHGGAHRLASSRQHRHRPARCHRLSEDVMRKELYADQEHTRDNGEVTEATSDGDRRTAEPSDDRIRGRRVRRLPRGNRASRVLARTAHVAAIRRARSPLSSRRRARLDQARRADPRVVNQPQRSQP